MANNGVVALSVAVVVLAALLVYSLTSKPTVVVRPRPTVEVIQPSTPIFYAETRPYSNWDLWPIPMFPHSQPWGGRHSGAAPLPHPPPGTPKH